MYGFRNRVHIFLGAALLADEMFNYTARSTNRPLMLDERNGRSRYRHTSGLTEDPARNLSMSEVINYNSPLTDIVLFIRQGSWNSECLQSIQAGLLDFHLFVICLLQYLSLLTLG